MHQPTLALILAAAAMAQTPPPSTTSQAAPPTASVSGTIRDAGTGAPMPDVVVSYPRSPEVTTDAQGRYTLRNVPAGQVRITAVGAAKARGFGPRATKLVTLIAGQELTGIDMLIRGYGEISGKILDQNKEPVPGVSVRLIAREYSLGTLRYVFAGAAQTDDQGEYVMNSVQSGRAYLLQVHKAYSKLDPISESPANPKLRKPAVVPTYYPGTASLEGAQALVLNPSERREGIDIRVLRTPSYCIDGVLQSGSGPAKLRFGIEERQPTSGASGNGSMFMASPGGITGTDGKIRICDLHPGDYTITVYSEASDDIPAFFGTAAVSIIDEDVTKLFVAAHPRVSVPGEIVWEGTPPDTPVSSTLNVNTRPMTRAPFHGEVPGARASIPGQFALDNLFMDEYSLQINGVPAGAYIKDVNYGGHSVLREPLRPGSAVGEAGLRIVLARDGGTVSAKVADNNNKPIADAQVVVMPASVASESLLAAAMVSGQTDQNGAWTSALLPPGKYYVMATDLPVDKTPECIGKLLRARTKSEEVDIGPGAAAQVSLGLVKIE
jgi:hypothetical protein